MGALMRIQVDGSVTSMDGLVSDPEPQLINALSASDILSLQLGSKATEVIKSDAKT